MGFARPKTQLTSIAGKRGGRHSPPSLRMPQLQNLNVLSLPALGATLHVEADSLAFLQSAEAARLNRREVHENVFAVLTGDEAKPFGIVKPLYCSLFHLCSYFP